VTPEKSERNPDYPPNSAWDKCDHWWEMAPGDWDSAFEQMRCLRCGCPGERTKFGSIYWPTG
jgi:hypothetical protein